MKAPKDDDFREVGVYPTYERPALRVLAAKPEYVVALKVMAMGDRSTVDDRDFNDLVGIAAELGLSSAEKIVEMVRATFPNKAIPSLAMGRLDEAADGAAARRRGP